MTARILALAAIAEGEWMLAENTLREDSAAMRDAACLNILGLCAELRGKLRHAKRFYGRAIRTDRNFAPAQQNMRRMFEVRRFGHSAEPPAVGDALTDLRLAHSPTSLLPQNAELWRSTASRRSSAVRVQPWRKPQRSLDFGR